MLERFKTWFQRTILDFHSRDGATGGWFHRVGRPAVGLYFVFFAFYYVASHANLIPQEMMIGFMASYLMFQLILGLVFIFTLAKVYGWSKYILG
ncbi:MAG: hypothetical protein ACFFEX_19235, partial [Candidatus Thorarchaeota archaeon]